MNKQNIRKVSTMLLCAATIYGTGALLLPRKARAQSSTPTYPAEQVAKGLAIAPVPLDFTGRDKNQVGYGSYLVNAVGGCNDCHTNPPYKADGDPFKGQKKAVNAAGYLAGGQAFGPFTSRNLTPPATGRNLANFKIIMRTGEDLRKLHPQISPLLQVMPWSVYQDMTDSDLEAIFAYLVSIPCVEGGPEEKADRCKPAVQTTAVAGPKDLTTQSFQLNLDGSKSTAADGKPLKYSWSTAAGYPQAAILFGDTATPTVQFTTRGPVTYKIDLKVTDSNGQSANDSIMVTYVGR